MISAGMDLDPTTTTKLKRIGIAVAAIVILLILLPSTFTYVNPGYVGIVIHRAGGGVDPTPLGPGIHARMPFATGIEEYPIFLKTLILAKSSNEGSSAMRRVTTAPVPRCTPPVVPPLL